MLHAPAISVVIPTYNRARTVTRAIDSVLSQTMPEFEIVVVDDGSTDNTAAVLASITDPRVSHHHTPNRGPSAARNFGAIRGKAPWIMYLDSDDELLPECLATMLDWLSRHPKAVFAFPRARRHYELFEKGQLVESFDDSGDTPPRFTLRDIFHRNAGFSCNAFTHHRRVFEDGLQWDEQLSSMEDWEFMMSLGERYPEGFLYVPVVLYIYRQRFGADNLVSKASYGTWADAFEYIYQKHQHDRQLTGQSWYPSKVEKWRRYQAEYEAGTRPAFTYHYFPKASREGKNVLE